MQEEDIMSKQLEIFYNLVTEFKKDNTIEGVLLSGSVAVGAATEFSDLDIIVLGRKDDFVSQEIDSILVEIHYTTYDSAINKLKNNPMEVYKYLDAKIEYDNGKVQEIITYAANIYKNYHVPLKVQNEIAYWLKSLKLKLESAFSKQDLLLVSYLVATNTWKVLEGIWAINQKPIPPSSSLYRRYVELELIPCPNWFEELLMENPENRGRIMIDCIDWILNNNKEVCRVY